MVVAEPKKTLLVKYAEDARVLVHERLTYWKQYYGYKYNRVSIRAQSTRWGSCSSKGNLNFNCRIVLLDRDLVDYIVVHELCHLKEFNHSNAFWALIEQTIPNYRVLKAELMKLQISGL